MSEAAVRDEARHQARRPLRQDPREPPRPPSRAALSLFAACLLLAILPVLLVSYPPVTDLPQLVSQIRLLTEAVADPASPYDVELTAPNRLAYGLVAVGWLVGGAEHAGRIALVLLFAAWLGSIHLLARHRGRSPAAAVLAGVLLFGHSLYWGFLGFLVGLPCFLLWFAVTTRPVAEGFGRRQALLLFLVAFLLYEAHVLWLLVGVVWMVIEGYLSRRPARQRLLRLLTLVPMGLLVLSWYLAFSQTSFDSETIWAPPVWLRLSPRGLVEFTFGGLRGWLEPVMLGALVLWAALALWRHFRTKGEQADRHLLAAGLLLLLLALALPQKHTNTIYLASRWMGPAWVLLLLGLPAPFGRPRLDRLAALGLAGLMSVTTAFAWVEFERQEMAGFEEALAALPVEPRLLSLDFVRRSPRFKTEPFFQLGGYAEARLGGRMGFSFSHFANSLVVRDDDAPRPWTSGLEWFPARLQPGDLAHFDYLLVHGQSPVHEELSRKAELEPLTEAPRWRLYKVRTSPGSES